MSFSVPGFSQYIEEIKNLDKRYVKAGAEIISELVAEGAELTRDNLWNAETQRGINEHARGRRPTTGRYESGRMYGTITDNSSEVETTASSAEGAFGWFPGDFEAYMRAQEEGGVPSSAVDGNRPPSLRGINIPPAHSLFNAFIPIREKFKKEVSHMIRRGYPGSSR